MSKNRKRVVSAQRKELKKSGFPKPGTKAKSRPFPGKPGMSMSEQREMFYGVR